MQELQTDERGLLAVPDSYRQDWDAYVSHDDEAESAEAAEEESDE